MPLLERFINPQTRVFDSNIRSLPGARLYFFNAGSTTPRPTYSDKEGTIPNENPVIANSLGVFPAIFLDGLYRVELRDRNNVTQAGWPIDNIGQDSAVVPFGSWSPIFTYPEGYPVTASDGNWYRSKVASNLGNDPISSPTEWEVIAVPVASSFSSNAEFITFSDSPDGISLDFDEEEFADYFSENSLPGVKLVNSPVADPDVLDWYQEGTFVPSVEGATTPGTTTYVSRTGTYTRIGNRVFFDISITWSASIGIGQLRVSGPPFASNNTTWLSAAAVGVPGSGTQTYGQITSSASASSLFCVDASTGSISPLLINGAGSVFLSGSYRTA